LRLKYANIPTTIEIIAALKTGVAVGPILLGHVLEFHPVDACEEAQGHEDRRVESLLPRKAA
jgi:hypothetical protein